MNYLADRLVWSVVLAIPLALLTVGFAGFVRLAMRRHRKIVRLVRRKGLSGRAS